MAFDFLSLFCAQLLFFGFFWLLLYKFSRISWVDVLWASSIGLWSFYHLLDNWNLLEPSVLIFFILTLLWSLRLSVHLTQRLMQSAGEDRR